LNGYSLIQDQFDSIGVNGQAQLRSAFLPVNIRCTVERVWSLADDEERLVPPLDATAREHCRQRGATPKDH